MCVLKKGDVELLSDIVGIVWESFDEHGAWQQKLANLRWLASPSTAGRATLSPPLPVVAAGSARAS